MAEVSETQRYLLGQESDERLIQVLAQTAVGFLATDAQDRIVMANPRFCEMVGYPMDEILKLCQRDITHPGEASETSEPGTVEKRYVKKNGAIVWTRSTMVDLPHHDETGGRRGAFIIDLTGERRIWEMEAHLAAIAGASFDALIALDIDGIITLWNPAAEKMFGYTAQEAVGKSDLLLVPERLLDEEGSIASRILAGELISNYETTRLRKDGSIVHVTMAATPIKLSNGEIAGICEVVRDVTAVTESKKRIHQLLREVNHRVKNQYSVMVAMVKETGRRAKTPAEFRRGIEDRIFALSLSHDLLVHADWSGASLETLAKEHMKLFERGQHVGVSGPDILLNTRATQYLGMALHELGSNATKFGALSTSAGRVQIIWRIEQLPAGGSEFHLCWDEYIEPSLPSVDQGSETGFGSVILRQATPQALNGTASIVRTAHYVQWSLTTDLESVTTER